LFQFGQVVRDTNTSGGSRWYQNPNDYSNFSL
jgi:hypothetical protein